MLFFLSSCFPLICDHSGSHGHYQILKAIMALNLPHRISYVGSLTVMLLGLTLYAKPPQYHVQGHADGSGPPPKQ